MSFGSLAEAGTGFFHAWSQDTYLDTNGMEDSEGVCLAVATIWIEQRYLAFKGGNRGLRQAFKDFMVTKSAKKIANSIQSDHRSKAESAISSGKSKQDIVASKVSPAVEHLKGHGLGLKGTVVCTDLRVLSDFVFAMPGFYLICAHGTGGGHAFGVHNRGTGAHSVTLFDPNYGEATWNSEMYYKKEFLAFFSSVRSVIYQNELSGNMIVLRLGAAG